MENSKNVKFALIGNPANNDHMYRCISYYKPNLKISHDALQKVFEWTPPYKGTEIPRVTSKMGKSISGFHVVCTFVPEMASLSFKLVYNKVYSSCQIAKEFGASIASLGAFTSVVLCNKQDNVADEIGLALTSGNTLTAYLTVKGVERAMELMDIKAADATIAVIGASGDIGSGCVKYFSNKVKRLILTATGVKRLNDLATTLRGKCFSEILIVTDNKLAVRRSDVVITTTSAISEILEANDFKTGAIICDVGYPKNVAVGYGQRDDILCFSGGLAKMPCDIDFGYDLNLPRKNTMYGCFAEGIVLAFENNLTNYSSGRGNITVEKMENIGCLAEKHGFVPALFYLGHHELSHDEIRQISRNGKGKLLGESA
jgi:predicted amino acid dehydrogenase